jgi:hypothetical protein
LTRAGEDYSPNRTAPTSQPSTSGAGGDPSAKREAPAPSIQR